MKSKRAIPAQVQPVVMLKRGWYWIRLEGDSELEPAEYDGEIWLVSRLASELWPAEIRNYIKMPKAKRLR